MWPSQGVKTNHEVLFRDGSCRKVRAQIMPGNEDRTFWSKFKVLTSFHPERKEVAKHYIRAMSNNKTSRFNVRKLKSRADWW